MNFFKKFHEKVAFSFCVILSERKPAFCSEKKLLSLTIEMERYTGSRKEELEEIRLRTKSTVSFKKINAERFYKALCVLNKMVYYRLSFNTKSIRPLAMAAATSFTFTRSPIL